jgi:hypothetical protein
MNLEDLLKDLNLNLTTTVVLPMREIYTVVAALFAAGLLLIVLHKVIK